MIFKLLDLIVGYVKDTPAWPLLRPFLVLLSLYVTALVLAYQFIEWQYRISPPLPLFLRSYLVKQITVIALGIGIAGVGLTLLRRRTSETPLGISGAVLRMYARVAFAPLAVLVVVALVAVPLLAYLAPRPVANVRVQFLDEPEVDRYAFAYLLYELNRLQKNWFFEVDFDVFNPEALTATQRARCAGPSRALCYAETQSGGRPFIGITTQALGPDFFWQNRQLASVVSTYGWARYAPPSVYEFLVYAVIVQSMVIHLTAHCSGLPHGSFKESRISHNDLFEFSPRRQALRPAILAAHLSRTGEQLLFNCFGAQYLATASNAVTLEWLRTGRVRDNLEKAFGVKL